MEHTARLAVLEQKFQFCAAFENFLQSLLEVIDFTLNNGGCKIFLDRSSEIARLLKIDGAMEYLNYVGFTVEEGFITVSNEHVLDNIISAKKAIEAKLKLFEKSTEYGAIKKKYADHSTESKLMTQNEFLLQIERNSQNVMRYENPFLLEKARKCIPLVTLRVRAIRRIRTQQRSIKRGSGETEQPYEMALLSELLSWFKTSFFRWVDKPRCRLCTCATGAIGSTTREVDGEICTVEVYQCNSCLKRTEFVRYNDPERLLTTRQGRCGEWANCFALFCRALGYQTRYVIDTTDHVWNEVYDLYSKRWVHVDPCEAATDTPLMYEHGWGKKLEYVIAYSNDDVQDVTWRYSGHHSEVRKRRNKCNEWELLNALMALRELKQRHLSAARKKYLQRRTVTELAEMLVERKPGDYENTGRISGSEEWRIQRGETGAPHDPHRVNTNHVFQLQEGRYEVTYYPVDDRYEYKVCRYAVRGEQPAYWKSMEWLDGIWESDNIRRNIENDWNMVYLARCDGNIPGHITWKFEAKEWLHIHEMFISQKSQVFESGQIEWSYSVDKRKYKPIQFKDGCEAKVNLHGSRLMVRATLSGGTGSNSWQHAQLFRAPLSSPLYGLKIILTVSNSEM